MTVTVNAVEVVVAGKERERVGDREREKVAARKIWGDGELNVPSDFCAEHVVMTL